MKQFKDVDGKKIKQGDRIELLDNTWLGETLFGIVRVIEDELAVSLNSGVNAPLIKGDRYRIIENYDEFFKERYDKIHGDGAYERSRRGN